MSPRRFSWFARLAGPLSSRRSAVTALCLACAAALLLLAYSLRDREPEHQGRPATSWIEEGLTNLHAIPDSITAFKKMGPEGVRFLGGELLREPSQADKWLLDHQRNLPAFLRKLFYNAPPAGREDTILLILAGLGTNAAPAVPSLLTWLEGKAQTFRFDVTPHALGLKIHTNRPFLPGGENPPWMNVTASNMPPMLFVPEKSTVIINTQTVVLATGQLGTNLSISVKPHQRQISHRAVQILTSVGGDDPRIAEALTYPVQLRTTEPPPRFGTNLRPAVLRSISSLIACVEHGASNRRLRALALLQLALPESDAVCDLMRRLLEDKDPQAFDIAAGALRRSTNEMDRAMALMATGLRASHGWYQRETDELRTLAQGNPSVVAYLEAKLEKNPTASRQVVLLKLIGETASRDQVDLAFIATFTNRLEAAVRAQAYETVGLLTANPALLYTAHTTRIETNPGDSTIISQAYLKLGDLGPAGHPGVPLLIAGLKSGETRLVIAAAESLGKMGIPARAALPDLQSLASHENPRIRQAAQTSLLQLTNVTRSGKGN